MDTDTGTNLVQSVARLLEKNPEIAELLGLTFSSTAPFADLVANLLASLCQNNAQVRQVVGRVCHDNPQLLAMSEHDIAETARRNYEPGGIATTLLFARGVHAVMAHRVIHQLWRDGNTDLSLALKAVCGRALATDIHPGASIGAGFWLDHGLGFVAGETVVIEDEVSIWHGVTLGSTLKDSGLTRHPRIQHGAVIGASAIILGNITIGARANVAAGSIVLQDVAESTAVVGAKSRNIGAAKISFI